MGLATNKAPAWALPVMAFAAALVSWVLVNGILAADPGRLLQPYLANPRVLLVVHLTTLGWAGLVVLGALHQLLPVVLQVGLYSEKLGFAGTGTFLAGLVIFLSGFAFVRFTWVPVGGSLLFAALTILLVNYALTLRAARPLNLEGRYVVVGLVSLASVALMGLFLALNFVLPVFGGGSWLSHLGFHALAGIFGFFTLTGMGVAYKLLPMFNLAHGHSARPQALVLGLGTASLVLLLGGAGFRWGSVVQAGGVLAAGTVALFLCDMTRIYRARKRRRPDLSMRQSLVALVHLGVVAAFGLVVSLGLLPASPLDPTGAKVVRLLVYLALFGWISGLIMAQLYKILPFVTWLKVYGSRVGREQVPLMEDLVQPRRDRYFFAAYHAGVVVTAIGLALSRVAVVQAGTLLTAVGAAGFAWAMYGVILRPLLEGRLRAVHGPAGAKVESRSAGGRSVATSGDGKPAATVTNGKPTTAVSGKPAAAVNDKLQAPRRAGTDGKEVYASGNS